MVSEGSKVVLVVFMHVCLTKTFLVSDGLQSVHTQYGEIIGHLENVYFDKQTSQVVQFLGIPYAEPPVGDLRFKKPVPITKMATPFAAHHYGPACIQPSKTSITAIDNMSEDCLYLNVFVPSNAGNSGFLPKPVMVWIHGGGFISGESRYYDGGVLSTYTDVILVTVNYRLGPVGFFSTHDDNARGNYGIWDQHMAFKWVHDNIRAFGGDNTNITIFGESAGSSSVIYQTMYPGNRGIFQRAIAESGTIAVWAVTKRETSYNSSITFASALGCNNTNHADLLACIRSKSSSEVKSAAESVQYLLEDYKYPSWVPVYDGDFVIADPLDLLNEAEDPNMASKYSHFREKDLLLGNNNYDGALYLSYLLRTEDFNTTLSASALRHKYVPNVIELLTKQVPSSVSVEAVMYEYMTLSNNYMDSFLNISTDAFLRAPVMKTAIAHAKGNVGNTFLYQFSTTPPNRLLPMPSFLDISSRAANHADEIVFVFGFGTHMRKFFNMHLNDTITQGQFDVAKLMMTTWANFARSGNPNMPTSVRPVYDIQWSPFTISDQNYLEITPGMTQKSLKSRMSARGVAFWNMLMPSLL